MSSSAISFSCSLSLLLTFRVFQWALLLLLTLMTIGYKAGHYCHFLLLLSLDAHKHVDDYSGTLGGVRKVYISALVTSP